MRKYTIVDYFGYNLLPRERMKSIKLAGFDGVVLLWADYFDDDYKDFPRYAEKEGLFVENTHAPYKYANSIWEDGVVGDAYTSHIMKCVEDCFYYNIPTLVVHPINGVTPLPQSTIGIERFQRIVEHAEKFNINIAVENQGNPEYIDYVFQNIKSDKLRFCFDSGHEKVYSPQLDLLDLYGDKLAALHLHDNDGSDDTHALPFTGLVDWAKISKKLKTIHYRGAIALETLNKGFEDLLDPVAFLGIALAKAKRVL